MIIPDVSWLTATLLSFVLPNIGPPQQSPTNTCFKSAQTLVGLVDCLQEFIVPQDFYHQESYLDAQPTNTQREAWSAAVLTLLHSSNNCSSLIVPSAIQDVYSATPFTDSDGRLFCVLYERTVLPRSKLFKKGWGFIIVPASQEAVSRDIHISAPHPATDGNTGAEAALLFKETGAKSLLIPGRLRTAYRAPSTCVAPTSRSTYYTTDTAHNDLEPFFDANVAIWTWQSQHGGCPTASCAFIQMHGKADTTCVHDDIFLSAGLRNSNWYTDNVDRPVKRLKKELLAAFNSDHSPEEPIIVSLPSDSRCILTATKNVVGRYLNNLPPPTSHNVCTREADADTTQGVFIHAEQSSRTASQVAWIQAVNNTFAEVKTL